MGYRIVYDENIKICRKQQHSKRKMRVASIILILALTLSIRFCLKQGKDFFRNLFLPGDPEVTETAIYNMISDIRSGEPVSDAVTVFCKEILTHAQLDD